MQSGLISVVLGCWQTKESNQFGYWCCGYDLDCQRVHCREGQARACMFNQTAIQWHSLEDMVHLQMHGSSMCMFFVVGLIKSGLQGLGFEPDQVP
jgi:hypothetical protein